MSTPFAKTEMMTVDGRRVRLMTAPPENGNRDNESPLVLPTLLVHGLGCTSEVWEPTLKEMARRDLCCTTLAPDLPGFGKTEGPRDALDMDGLADWLIQFLDARRLERVHLAGNSMGCQVIFSLARRYPDRVGGLVLQGPTTGDRLIPPWRYVVGLVTDGFHESIPYNLRLMKMYSQMGVARYLATVGHMLHDDPVEQAQQVSAPCLIIRGGRDTIVSDKTARKLAAALPDAVYVPLDSAAHAIEFNNPKEFTDAMLTFLSRTEERLGIKNNDAACSAAVPNTPAPSEARPLATVSAATG